MKLNKLFLKKIFAGVMASLIVLQFASTLYITAENAVISGHAGSVSSVAIKDNKLVIDGTVTGSVDGISSLDVYSIPIYQNENNINYSTLNPIGKTVSQSSGGSELPEETGDIVIGDFENGSTDGFTAGAHTSSVTSVLQDPVTAANPGVAASGGCFLQAVKSAEPATQKSYIEKNFTSPLNLTDYRYINFYFWGWGGTSSGYSIDLELTGNNETIKTYTLSYSSGGWQALSVDISDFAARSSVSSLRIAYYGNDLQHHAGAWSGLFSVDGIKASKVTAYSGAGYDPNKELTVESFDSSASGFAAGSNANSVVKGSFAGNSSCLEAAKNGVSPTTPSTIVKTFTSALDLSDYKLFAMDVTSWGGAAEKYAYELKLSSSDGSFYTDKKNGLADCWSTIFFDISGFAGKDAVSSITISFFCEGQIVPAAAAGWGGHFFIDNLKAYGNFVRVFDFENNSSNGFTGIDNIYPGTAGSYTGQQPYPLTGSHGTYYYKAQKSGVPSTVSSVGRTFSTPLNLENLSFISFDFFNHGGGSTNETYQVDLEVQAGTAVKTCSTTVVPNTWNKLKFSIADFDERDVVTAIRIKFRALIPLAISDWNGAFFVDNFCFGGIGELPGGSVHLPEVISLLTDFESGADGWHAGENTSETSIVSKGHDFGGTTGSIPPASTEGQFMIKALKAPVLATIPSFAEKKYPVPLNLSGANKLNYDIFCYGGASTSYVTKLVLKTEDGQRQEFTASVHPDGWQNVSFDITTLTDRSSIVSVQIGYCGTDTAVVGNNGWIGQFYLDRISVTGTFSSPATVAFNNFESGKDGWVAGDNTLAASVVTAAKGHNFGTDTNPNYIPSAPSEGASMLCAQKTAKFATEMSYVKKTYSTPVDLSEYSKMVYDIFCFGGASSSYLSSVRLTAQNGSSKTYFVNIVSDSWQTVGVDLTLFAGSDQIVSIEIGFAGADTDIVGDGAWTGQFFLDNLCLMVQPEGATLKTSNGTLSSDRSFKFRIPLSIVEDLGEKFVVVATKTNGDRQLVDSAKYVINAEELATNTDPYPETTTIKGLQVQLNSDSVRLGVQHAAINISLDSLLTMKNHGSSTIVYYYKGKPYYFNKNIINEFDSNIYGLSENKMVVNAILLMYPTELNNPDSPNKYICHPDAEQDSAYHIDAVNLTDQTGVEYYEAMVSFLSTRYNGSSGYGRISGYIVGNEIGAQEWHNMGKKPVGEFVRQFERQLRLTNTIVKQGNANARVYVSLDHYWEMNIVPKNSDDPIHYNNKDILRLLNQYSKEGGDYGWNVAFHPYPEVLNDPRTWNDATATDSFDTKRITFKNLQVLPEYLKQEQYLYNGHSRRIILSEQGFNTRGTTEKDYVEQAAAYAYAYYKAASIPEIDAFILHRHVDHSQEFNLSLGLWSNIPGEICQPDTPKKIYEVFKNIDTVNSLGATAFALDFISKDTGRTISNWKQLIPEFDLANITSKLNRPVTETASAGIPLDVSGETIISSGSLANWSAVDNTNSLKKLKDSVLDKDVVTASVNGTVFKEFKGLTYTPQIPLDLTDTPVLTVNVKAGNLGAVKTAEFLYRVYSGDRVVEGSFVGQSEKWNLVAIDLAGFSGISSVDKIKIWARPSADRIWRTGTISVERLSVAATSEVRNLIVTTDVSKVTELNQSVNITVENKGNRDVSDTMLLEGLNGLGIDLSSVQLSLSQNSATTFSVKITALDVPKSKSGTIQVTIGQQKYILALTEIVFADYIMDGDDAVLGDFEDGLTDGWLSGDNTEEVISVEKGSTLDTFPSSAKHGFYTLEARKASVPATTPSYVIKHFSAPLDFSNFGIIAFDFFGWAGTSNDYAVELKLTAFDGSVQSYTKWYSGSGWKEYSIDISDFIGKNNLKSLAIAYYGVDNFHYNGKWNGYFYIDHVRGVYGTGSGSTGSGTDSLTEGTYTKLIDPKSQVTVTGLTLRSDLELSVITDESPFGDMMSAAELQLSMIERIKVLKVYEISFLDNGGYYVPKGTQTVTMPLPESYNGKLLYVIAHLKDDGTVSYIVPRIKNRNFMFETDSFSQFAVLSAGLKDPSFNPETGDSIKISVAVLFIAALSTFVLAMARKNKSLAEE